MVAQSVAEKPAPDAVEPLLTTDQDNMALFIKRIALYLLRYVPERGWLSWDGKRWEPDRGGKHWELVKLLSAAWLEQANEAEGAGFADRAREYRIWSARCRQRNRLEAALKMAETDPRVLVLPEDLDHDGDVLNTVSGTLHLPSGLLLPHLQEDLISKITGTYYDAEAEAPCWEAFLRRILPEPAVQAFVQRAVGYSLTGHTSEQCFFLLHGRGSNGKTTFLRALIGALGDYAVTARPETFMARDGDAIPNDLAALAGARFVISSETNDGQRFDESRIKLFTGGDTITARFLHREYFTFTPSGKLWIACNHKPEIRGTDLGIWRRVCLVPFTQTIPVEEQDRELPSRLLLEAPGILAWAVRGYQMWKREGLQPPPAVLAAVRDYRLEQDALGDFIEDRCVLDASCKVTKAALYAVYVEWCEASKARPWSSTRFSLRMKERDGIGELRQPHSGTRCWTGIGLRG